VWWSRRGTLASIAAHQSSTNEEEISAVTLRGNWGWRGDKDPLSPAEKLLPNISLASLDERVMSSR
jgi:hypothetical protein